MTAEADVGILMAHGEQGLKSPWKLRLSPDGEFRERIRNLTDDELFECFSRAEGDEPFEVAIYLTDDRSMRVNVLSESLARMVRIAHAKRGRAPVRIYVFTDALGERTKAISG